MKSLHLKRMVTGALAATAVAALVASSHTSAIADPNPAPEDASEALTEFRQLQRKAEKLNEDHLKAQDDLRASEKELRTAKSDLAKAKKDASAAKSEKAKYGKVVDRFASASYSGTQYDSVTAAMGGDSVQELLQKSATVDVLAAERNSALESLSSAVRKAEKAESDAGSAEKRAQSSRDAAAKHEKDISSRQTALDQQVDRAEQAYQELSTEDRETVEDSHGESEDTEAPEAEEIDAPGGAAGKAVQAAMSKRGSPYSYGATGPDSFDCSGLTSWAYQQAGKSLPRSSSAQSSAGQSVTKDELQPGDLVFFYQPVSHVGMYIGDGQMVHAPTSGDVVKVDSVMWNEFSGAQRVA